MGRTPPLQVGMMRAGGISGDGADGGTHGGVPATKCWGRQQHVASMTFAKRWVGGCWMVFG